MGPDDPAQVLDCFLEDLAGMHSLLSKGFTSCGKIAVNSLCFLLNALHFLKSFVLDPFSFTLFPGAVCCQPEADGCSRPSDD